MAGFWGNLFSRTHVEPASLLITEPLTYSSNGITVVDPGMPLPIQGREVIEEFWRTQPNLRKVVDFVARNVASVPLHVHERVSDTDRPRITDGPLDGVLSHPQPRMGAYRFWHAVVSDSLLYDRWAVLARQDRSGAWSMIQLPSWRLRFITNNMRQVTGIDFWTGDPAQWQKMPMDEVVFDFGYAPNRAGLSPIETLKDVLDESAEAVRYRRQVWANGARADTWIGRPVDAPKWEADQRERFGSQLRNAYTGRGENAGGIPVLEDGMALNDRKAFNSDQVQDLDGRRLSAIEVAAAFHVAPELVGAQQGNYSNVREYRQMLYRDSLGPYITAIEDAVNAQLTPRLTDGRQLYVEAAIEAKLRGSFEEQAQSLQSAVGRPWMSADEARGRLNMSAMGGEASSLVVPLNVLMGGQASPRDSGSQNRRSVGVRVKVPGPDHPHVRKHEQVIVKFFKHQSEVVRSALGAKAASWWDADRWDDELTKDLLPLYLSTSTASAHAALNHAGLPTEDYDKDQTVHFLTAVAGRVAEQMNHTTKDQIDEARKADDPSEAIGNVFTKATDSRAAQAATTTATFAVAFGATESAKQHSHGTATKTWVVTSSNPRPSHSAMDGETVPIDSTFSNGGNWPADGNLSADESAGCTCEVQVNY